MGRQRTRSPGSSRLASQSSEASSWKSSEWVFARDVQWRIRGSGTTYTGTTQWRRTPGCQSTGSARLFGRSRATRCATRRRSPIHPNDVPRPVHRRQARRYRRAPRSSIPARPSFRAHAVGDGEPGRSRSRREDCDRGDRQRNDRPGSATRLRPAQQPASLHVASTATSAGTHGRERERPRCRASTARRTRCTATCPRPRTMPASPGPCATRACRRRRSSTSASWSRPSRTRSGRRRFHVRPCPPADFGLAAPCGGGRLPSALVRGALARQLASSRPDHRLDGDDPGLRRSRGPRGSSGFPVRFGRRDCRCLRAPVRHGREPRLVPKPRSRRRAARRRSSAWASSGSTSPAVPGSCSTGFGLRIFDQQARKVIVDRSPVFLRVALVRFRVDGASPSGVCRTKAAKALQYVDEVLGGGGGGGGGGRGPMVSDVRGAQPALSSARADPPLRRPREHGPRVEARVGARWGVSRIFFGKPARAARRARTSGSSTRRSTSSRSGSRARAGPKPRGTTSRTGRYWRGGGRGGDRQRLQARPSRASALSRRRGRSSSTSTALRTAGFRDRRR